MIRKIQTYLQFLLKSTNQHGVHSPFVFNFVTKCLYKKQERKKYSVFVKNKKQLLNNLEIIEVQDFGAGSKVFKSNQRRIRDIAKIAGISNKRGELLIKTASYFNAHHILEIGSSLGISTVALALADKKSNIITIEGCKNTAKIAQRQFKQLNLDHIQLYTEPIEHCLEKIVTENVFDLIFFDGNHTKEATLNYFHTCLNSIHNESIFIFDDIYWSNEMRDCWEEIKKHPKVTVTIDTYKWGLIFFRKEQAKEHFTIRV
ncbi:MAG: class I SAM-dependent methyltransferase [Flavobacteriaceae bacterium]